MLKTNNLFYEIENRVILDNITIEIPKAKIVGLLGPNGAGKTTLMQLLAGFKNNYTGEVSIRDNTNRNARLQHVVYLNHQTYFSEKWTIQKLCDHYKKFTYKFNHQRFMGMAKTLNIDLSKRMNRLSRGEKERVMLALTLAQEADYYLLDEPLTGIDMITREEIIRSILTFANEIATLVISSHYIEVFELLFDEVYFIKDTKILGKVDMEIMRTEENKSLSEYYVQMYKEEAAQWSVW